MSKVTCDGWQLLSEQEWAAATERTQTNVWQPLSERSERSGWGWSDFAFEIINDGGLLEHITKSKK